MIKQGDVYTYNLSKANQYGLRACYRPFIVTGIDEEKVTAVPLTTHVLRDINHNRVYTTMTVNGITKEVCILSDMPITIPKEDLIKKIAHVDKTVFEEIMAKISSKDNEVEKNTTGVILEDGQDLKEVLRILNGMNSSKSKWGERIISFVLGVLASIIAALIYSLIS